jgi:hypothetical protein
LLGPGEQVSLERVDMRVCDQEYYGTHINIINHQLFVKVSDITNYHYP